MAVGKYMLCALALTCILMPWKVDADGKVKIKFLTYENRHGKLANGNCCDGRWIACQSNGCDHFFKICLDKPGGQRDLDKCAYGKRESDRYSDKNSITFGSKIKDLDNPLEFDFFEPMPSEVVLKVDVNDYDRIGRNDHVDFFEQRINLDNVPSNTTLEYTLQKKTTLRVQVIKECVPNFYGPRCVKFCYPAPQKQYICNPTTGEKICNLGWRGIDCNELTGRHV